MLLIQASSSGINVSAGATSKKIRGVVNKKIHVHAKVMQKSYNILFILMTDHILTNLNLALNIV